MNENIQLQMSTSVKKQRSIGTSIALFSQDIDNYSFDITFTDLELQAGDQVEVLAKLQGGKLEHKSSANLVEVDGELIARYVFDTKLIDSEGHVFCYVYLKRDDKSSDVGAFYFEVDLSELDKVGGKIAEVYDGRYEDLVAGFEIRLQEYRDSLPQADSVRAEVDEALNQFGVDSQAKLSQYDADAQQVIADWEQGADELVDSKLTDIQTDAGTLINGAIDDFNQRGDAEIADWRVVADSELEEYLADKFVIQNLVENGDFTINELSSNFNINSSLQEFTINEGKLVLKPKTFTWNNYIRIDFPQNIGDKIYCHFTIESPIATQVDWRVGGVLRPTPYGPGESTISFVNTVSTVNNIMYLYTQDFSPSMVIKLDKVKAINLTQTFGAGNEPTKTEMDELIKITGYFDEIMLTQKQLLNWQMKLMRQNRNALIALGGTII